MDHLGGGVCCQSRQKLRVAPRLAGSGCHDERGAQLFQSCEQEARNRREGVSGQCASSTTRQSGPAAARFAHNQYRPCSIANEGSTPDPGAASAGGAPGKLSRPAAPCSRSARSDSDASTSGGSTSWRTHSKGEIAFQLDSARPEHAHPAVRHRRAPDGEQCRLADPRGPLDHQELAAAHARLGQGQVDPGQLRVPLEQRSDGRGWFHLPQG